MIVRQMYHSIWIGTKAPQERPRVGQEKFSDGFRVGQEKNSDGTYFQSDVHQGYTLGKHYFYIAEHVYVAILSVSEHFRRYLI